MALMGQVANMEGKYQDASACIQFTFVYVHLCISYSQTTSVIRTLLEVISQGSWNSELADIHRSSYCRATEALVFTFGVIVN